MRLLYQAARGTIGITTAGWHSLLQASVRNILNHYNINSGVLDFDDSGKKRSKRTTRITGAHKVKDKATGGYFNGQELVFMVLITDVATIPVGFRFFEPDPVLSAWRKKDKQLRLKGVAKQDRPKRPKPDHQHYPTMQSLALEMLREFVEAFPDVKVKGVLADALYGTGEFMETASALTTKGQIVSQLRSNQKVAIRNS